MAKQKEFLSTGETAQFFSVTPDTVLKWVKAGKISASRTPGGHYRIRRNLINHDINTDEVQQHAQKRESPFRYCWEFKAKFGKVQPGCHKCIVYRSRTKRCYEMSNLPYEAGHSKLFCSGTCDDCDYYNLVSGQKHNVLVVSDRSNLRVILEADSKKANFNLEFTDCEYHCSMIVEKFRPDFVVMDCSLGDKRSREFAKNIAQDPRIPFVRVILAGEKFDFPEECDKDIFAFIKRTFTARELEKLIENLKN